MAEQLELRDFGTQTEARLHPIRRSTDYSHDPADMPQRDINNFRTAFRYEIGRRIGKGAYGTVYIGTFADTVTTYYRNGRYECIPGENFAVKYITAEAKPPPNVHDWYDEAVAMIELDHRNLVKLITVVTMSGKRLYIFMEYCDRGSMYDLLEKIDSSRIRRQQVSEYQAQQWCAHVLLGLQHMHNNNWAHLDIHTGNILFATNPENRNEIVAKLTDFGLVLRLTPALRFEDMKALSIVFTQILFMNGRTNFRSEQSQLDANNMVRRLARRQYNTVDQCLADAWLTAQIPPDSSACSIM